MAKQIICTTQCTSQDGWIPVEAGTWKDRSLAKTPHGGFVPCDMTSPLEDWLLTHSTVGQ